MEKLVLNYIGEDSWNRQVFKNEEGKIFKDTSLGMGKRNFCTSSYFDGEPDTPIIYIKKYKDLEIEITGLENETTKEEKFNYMMLDRLRNDCNYYLGYGQRDKKCLWALDEKEQIEEMKKIYNSFSDNKKPEWLTWKNILKYEKQMC